MKADVDDFNEILIASDIFLNFHFKNKYIYVIFSRPVRMLDNNIRQKGQEALPVPTESGILLCCRNVTKTGTRSSAKLNMDVSSVACHADGGIQKLDLRSVGDIWPKTLRPILPH